MNDKIFIDTNILVYAHDHSEQNKQQKAKDLIINGIVNENLVLSTQVLSEFYVTVTKKIKRTLSPSVAKKELILLSNVEIVEIDFQMIVHAIDILEKHHISYWDSLIVASACRAKCSIIYSEDLNYGQLIESIRINNPFVF